jgi:hypothetical protein
VLSYNRDTDRGKSALASLERALRGSRARHR